MRKNEWHVIGRGFNGWHAKGVNVSSSGGDIVERTHVSGARMPSYVEEAVEGALVYDAQHLEGTASDSVFVHLACSGPMVDPKLPPDGVKRFDEEDRKAARRMLPGLSGEFATLATAAQDESYSGLDYVGVAVFERLLRTVPGIKIGHVRNGKIVWES